MSLYFFAQMIQIFGFSKKQKKALSTRLSVAFCLFLFLLLLILGGVNVYKKSIWKKPWDGVTWAEKSEGLTAIRVEIGSPAYLHGIKKGDILYSINNTPVKNKIDVAKSLWTAGSLEQKVTYEIVKGGLNIFPSFFLYKKGVDPVYFFFALVGLTALVIGFIVLLTSKKPLSPPSLYIYALSLAFYSFNIFSPSGALDTLDTIFFFLDKFAFLAFPPLLLHFFLIFPQRKPFLREKLPFLSYLYLPGLILLFIRILFHLPFFKNMSESLALQLHQTSGKLDLIHFGLFSSLALVAILHSTWKPANLMVRKQLRWVFYGIGLGIIPFTLFYIIPFVFGQVPSRAAELSVILQALIPLSLFYSISGQWQKELETLLKKAFSLISSAVVLAMLYFIITSQTRGFAENRLNALLLGMLAIILGATLLPPLKRLFQSILDRAVYKRSYKYRKTLLTISKELGRERNLQKLSRSLLELIANALSLRSIALLLPVEEETNSFSIFKSKGRAFSTNTKLHFDSHIYQGLREKDFLSPFSFPEQKELQKKLDELSAYGFFHFLPLRAEDQLIGCLAMGKKQDNSFLSSADWELLTTISPPVALALENAYLYNQANIRAMELERLKDYSENIIESLTMGVAVIDQQGKIIGWNRVLEKAFSRKKEDVFNKTLIGVLGHKNFSVLFPLDSQKEFRLLSEIPLEMPDGEVKIFDIAKTPLMDNQMNSYGTVIAFEDITEKITLQQQLLTSEKLASIGLLSAGVAHEINTPLTGISSYVQILQKKLVNSRHAPILEKIEAQTERVARIIKNLLNFARNPSETSFCQVNLKEILEEIVSLIEYKLKTMNIALRLKLSSLRPLWAEGERLRQVFLNIILNAVDAMPRGGTLTIDLRQTNSEAVIKIEDTGTGIKEQDLPHIFDPFFTTKGVGKGTGLGLSISYAIVKEHEGHITVESEYEKGAVFSIFIPMDLDKRKMKKISAS